MYIRRNTAMAILGSGNSFGSASCILGLHSGVLCNTIWVNHVLDITMIHSRITYPDIFSCSGPSHSQTLLSA